MSDPLVPERRKPSVFLIVSLCLNAALIGLGAMVFLRGGPPPHEPKTGLSPLALMRMVPAEKDKIQAVMDAHRGRIHQLRQASMQAREELFGALSAAQFDRAALDKALAAVESADGALEAETMKATADSVALLTPAERESVANQVHQPNKGWLRHMLRRR